MTKQSLRAGVVGVGSMGSHHARVYNELSDTKLVGVTDKDSTTANEVAERYGTESRSLDDLLTDTDLISVTVPTRAHYSIAKRAIEQDVGILVEKPFVEEFGRGRDLINRANRAEVPLAVGHIERFNPVVDIVSEALGEAEIIAVAAQRLGPPVNRDSNVGVVMDLMIHDIDIVSTLIDSDITDLTAVSSGTGDYATAQFEFGSGTVCSLTASRITQERVRELSVTTREFHIEADYINQSVDIYRHSSPEYQQRNGNVSYKEGSIVERPAVDGEEPLKRELRSFAEAVRTGSEPRITGEDGLQAFSIANEIESIATSQELGQRKVTTGDITT